MTIVDYVNRRFRGLRDEVDITQEIARRAADAAQETTSEQFPIYDFSELPTELTQHFNAFVSDGRKPTEEADAGTGVPAWYDPSSQTWISYMNGEAVEI